MDKRNKRNINRYWIEKNSQVVVRNWTEEEYKSADPKNHILEKHWSFSCPHCSFLPHLCANKDEAEHSNNVHRRYTRHEGMVEYKDFELCCVECREEYSKEFNAWFYKQDIY